MVDETLPDGSQVTMGQRLRTFESGDTPHENNYSADGKRIFHASIGKVYTPGDDGRPVPIGPTDHQGRPLVPDRAQRQLRGEATLGHGQGARRGRPPEHEQRRAPDGLTPDERFIYFQVSFFHGLVEFDMTKQDNNGGGDYAPGTRRSRAPASSRASIPLPNRVPDMPREQYVLDSAHHGLSINDAGSKLCVAGTMDDYAAIVDRRPARAKIFDTGTDRPRLPQALLDGRGPGQHLLDVDQRQRPGGRARLRAPSRRWPTSPVGDHPQRVRHGVLPTKLIRSW